MHRLLFLFLLLPHAVYAAEAEYLLVIKNHRFQPEEITIPSDKKVRLIVDNQDAAPEEFESYALNREKVIPGKTKATIYIGPLKPGHYPFFGEFNQDTAKGVINVEYMVVVD